MKLWLAVALFLFHSTKKSIWQTSALSLPQRANLLSLAAYVKVWDE
jgi:hypothetical protein